MIDPMASFNRVVMLEDRYTYYPPSQFTEEESPGEIPALAHWSHN